MLVPVPFVIGTAIFVPSGDQAGRRWVGSWITSPFLSELSRIVRNSRARVPSAFATQSSSR